MLKNISLTYLVFVMPVLVFAQNAQNHRAITFPDVTGYKTLICDLHTHSVFSDGSVWPDIRVYEALRDGLDVLAVTEHLEYQPHREDIPHPDRNRSYELALKYAEGEGLMIINGSEITRRMPPGHANAIFISDANKLVHEDSLVSYAEASKQGAFIFWNHPNWTAQRSDGIARLTDLHRTLIAEGKLHGIEVVNEMTYSDEALQIALDQNLTILGTSDIHGLVDWQFHVHAGGHRPVTLVFAEEKTEESVKQALFEGRTVAWFNNLLIGKEENVVPLIQASLRVKEAWYHKDKQVVSVQIDNSSDAEFILRNKSPFTLHSNADVFTLEPNAVSTLEVKVLEILPGFDLTFEVLNAVTAPAMHPDITLVVRIPQE